uniref:Replication-associated protein ORF2/G2P domain-containing protein n=1 Tax=uncultured prokaryote TaxID=198431 RepID=A0A0H5Q5M0_9ZZZZ|nr:hypothetical protein [uncultured prokaryote]
MPTIRLYQGGLTMGAPGGNPNPPKRGQIKGWTYGALLRQRKWLWSVARDERLTGYGYAITLTVATTPPSAAAWHAVRTAWIKRLQRAGMTRLHWVIEWQERGTPHLHVAAYWDHELTALERAEIVAAWLAAASDYGPSWGAQLVKPVTGVTGWFEYMTKHASRGLQHYQRAGIPPGWETSGRLWGHVGEWPVEPPIEVIAPAHVGPRFRRLVCSWRVARAREDLHRSQRYGDTPQRLAQRRAALVFARRSSRVLEDGWRFPGDSEGVPESVGLRLLEAAMA